MILMGNESCPYGADECPKIKDIKIMLETNRKDINALNDSVIQLNATIKYSGAIIGVAVAIICAIIGVVSI